MKASTRKTKAEKLAQRIWEESGEQVPVNAKELAESHQIRVRTESLEDDVSGMMVTSEAGSASILVNKNHTRTRQNFSTAHELGHFMLHRAISPIFVDSKQVFFRDAKAAEGTHWQEVEANAFAAELLMPESYVRKIFTTVISPMELESSVIEKKIKETSKFLGVSQQALTIRLNRLGIVSD